MSTKGDRGDLRGKYLLKGMPGGHDEASVVSGEGGLHRVSGGRAAKRLEGDEDSFCRRAKSKKFYLCAHRPAKLECQAQGEAQTSERWVNSIFDG